MSRSFVLFAACTLSLAFGLPGISQDSPSLGDLARQAQKDKASAAAKKVFTNDDLPAGSASSASGIAGGSGTALSPQQQIAHLDALQNQLDSMDRATLAKNALGGSEANFPGRSKWEEKLYEAKQVFVAQGRDLIKRAQEIDATAKELQNVHDPNDPRVKELASRLQQLVRDGVQIGATFQGVIEEGKDLAGQSSSH